jgi:hypothetical protein
VTGGAVKSKTCNILRQVDFVSGCLFSRAFLEHQPETTKWLCRGVFRERIFHRRLPSV